MNEYSNHYTDVYFTHWSKEAGHAEFMGDTGAAGSIVVRKT
jgi:hypothetical protein